MDPALLLIEIESFLCLFTGGLPSVPYDPDHRTGLLSELAAQRMLIDMFMQSDMFNLPTLVFCLQAAAVCLAGKPNHKLLNFFSESKSGRDSAPCVHDTLAISIMHTSIVSKDL